MRTLKALGRLLFDGLPRLIRAYIREGLAGLRSAVNLFFDSIYQMSCVELLLLVFICWLVGRIIAGFLYK